jgi:hypothetical protein
MPGGTQVNNEADMRRGHAYVIVEERLFYIFFADGVWHSGIYFLGFEWSQGRGLFRVFSLSLLAGYCPRFRTQGRILLGGVLNYAQAGAK